MPRKSAKPKIAKDVPEEQVEIDLLDLLMRGPSMEKDFLDISLENYRTHYIIGDIDEISAKDACEFLLKSFFQDRTKPVTLVINSPGGVCTDGFAIIDLMASLGLVVRTLALGQVCSMGFMIFAAGTKGERVISPNCTLMSHQYSGGIEGKYHDLDAASKEVHYLHDRCVAHLVKYTGLPVKKVKEALLPKSDVFLTPEEAIKFGVGDRLLDKFHIDG